MGFLLSVKPIHDSIRYVKQTSVNCFSPSITECSVIPSVKLMHLKNDHAFIPTVLKAWSLYQKSYRFMFSTKIMVIADQKEKLPLFRVLSSHKDLESDPILLLSTHHIVNKVRELISLSISLHGQYVKPLRTQGAD